jgi:hypothetical protein
MEIKDTNSAEDHKCSTYPGSLGDEGSYTFSDGTAHFKNVNILFEYQHLLLL